MSVPSAKLTRGTELEVEEIASSVDVVNSERFAAGDIAVLRSDRGRGCLEHELIGAISTTLSVSGPTMRRSGGFSSRHFPVDAPGTTGSAGVRITETVTYSYSETTVPVYIDFVVFTLEPVEVTVTAVSPVQPGPEEPDEQLLQLLLTRAKATPL